MAGFLQWNHGMIISNSIFGGSLLKIGEFANLFDVKKETVRFYTDKNLLTPVKIGSFYDYDRNCVVDMNKILELKDMDFNLEEIS